MKYVVLDIETANPVADWRDHDALGISWAVVYRSCEDRYMHFQAKNIQAMAANIADADMIVGWNSIAFDIPLLYAVGKKMGVPLAYRDIPHCDLMALCEDATGHKLGLDEVAAWTIGLHKIGARAMAPALARAGEWAMLATYCEHDVMLTRRLFEFASRHGYLMCEGNQRIGIQVPGGVPACMPESQAPSEKQLRYLADLQQRAGEEVRLQGLSKGQVRNEIERLRGIRP